MQFVNSILDTNLKDTLHKASQAFIIRSAGLFVHYIFNIYLARSFGADGTGTYYLALTIVTFGALLGRFGLDNALIRFIAVKFSQGSNSTVKGIYIFSISLTVVLSVAITLVLYLLSPLISSQIFNDPSLQKPLQYMVFSIIPFSLLNLIAAMLKGIENIRDSILVSGALIPISLLFIAFIIKDSFGIVGIIAAYNASTFVVFLFALWRWHSSVPAVFLQKPSYINRQIMVAAIPVLVIALMNLFLSYSNTFILGIFDTLESETNSTKRLKQQKN